MNSKTEKSFKAVYRHFQDASNQHGDAATVITMTGAGLHVLTEIIEEHQCAKLSEVRKVFAQMWRDGPNWQRCSLTNLATRSAIIYPNSLSMFRRRRAE